LALGAIFVGAILLWGTSMWALRKSLTGPLLQIFAIEADVKSMEPYLRRARAEPLSYETAVSTRGALGKPILWTVLAKDSKTALIQGATDQPLLWSNPALVQDDLLRPEGKPFLALGILEKVGRPPTVRFLGTPIEPSTKTFR